MENRSLYMLFRRRLRGTFEKWRQYWERRKADEQSSALARRHLWKRLEALSFAIWCVVLLAHTHGPFKGVPILQQPFNSLIEILSILSLDVSSTSKTQ